MWTTPVSALEQFRVGRAFARAYVSIYAFDLVAGVAAGGSLVGALRRQHSHRRLHVGVLLGRYVLARSYVVTRLDGWEGPGPAGLSSNGRVSDRVSPVERARRKACEISTKPNYVQIQRGVMA